MTIDYEDTIQDDQSKPLATVVEIKRPRGRPKSAEKKAESVSANKKHSLGKTEDRFTTRPIEEIAALISERFEFRYDEILLRSEYREVQDGAPRSEWQAMRDAVMGRVLSHTRIYAREDGPDALKSRTCVFDAIEHMADNNKHNPIKSYLEACLSKFKSTATATATTSDPISNLQHCFTLAPGKEHMLVFLTRWLLGCVARVHEENGHQNFMLTLLGEQGWGKSKFAEWLCSGVQDGKFRDLFQEGQIRPDNKDHVLRLAQKWIWCVNELDGTTRKQDVAELKDFLTTGVISERPAYGRHVLTLRPVCSMLGAVNVETFLKDDTGNRRFVSLPMVKAIDFRKYLDEVDVDLLWGQVMFLYQCGSAFGQDFDSVAYPHHPTLPNLSAEEKAWQRDQNEECYDSDPIEDWLFQWIQVTGKPSDLVPSFDILTKAKNGELIPGSNDRTLQIKIASVLRRKGVSAKNAKLIDGRVVKVFVGVSWKTEADRSNLFNLGKKLAARTQ